MFSLRRGFRLEPGQKVLMVEDVVTTGLSSREAIDAVKREGGEVIAEASLVDRSNGSVDLGVPFFPPIRLDVPTYEADKLPPELAAIPAIKPGSRKEAVDPAPAPRRQHRSRGDHPHARAAGTIPIRVARGAGG